MSEITYKSDQVTVVAFDDALDISSTEGISCIWSGSVADDVDVVCFSWNFDWSELKARGISNLAGQITVTSNDFKFPKMHVEVDLKEDPIQRIDAVWEIEPKGERLILANFEFSIIPISGGGAETVKGDSWFEPNELSDGCLVVEGDKFYVNKGFLSCHSEFFRALFSSNFKDNELKEVEIKEISSEDFKLLLATINPVNVFPCDTTSEKLLELADRFLVPSITYKVAHHLLNHSSFSEQKLLYLADKYMLEDLLDKSVGMMNSFEKMKALESFKGYSEISNFTKAKLFDRVLKLM